MAAPGGIATRVAALAGLTAGLAASPLAAGADPLTPAALGACLAAGAAVARSGARGRVAPDAPSAATTGPRALGGAAPVLRRGRAAPCSLALPAALALAASLLGLGLGLWRLAAIDAGAATPPPGERASATGHLSAPPRASGGTLRLELATPDGRLGVEAPVGSLEASPGDAVRARGTVREPEPWEAGRLRRRGIARVLVARELSPLDAPRAGLAGWLDGIRGRVEAALGRGAPEGPAALLRGFILGQDDAIDPATVEDFRRSGLAHLLAVSGTNVMLLSLLAFAALGLLGVPLRARLGWVLALIAIYVPVAGAGPSIQRAGVMGAAGVIAVLASRPRSRGYALLLAAAATLALNPRASGAVGWQLSFAAVAGILLWTARIRDLLLRPGRGRAAPIRRAVAEGAGLTIAATVATAPLMAHHFGAFSVTSLPANLLALPAVPAVMWLGMTAGAAGQGPALPVEPITAAAGAFAAYIAQVAEWAAGPGWAFPELTLDRPLAVALAYLLLGGALTLVLRWARRRRALRPGRGALAAALAGAAALALALAPAASGLLAGGEPPPAPRAGGLAISILDAGQGDAILLEPGDGDPVLIDAGPPGAGVAAALRDRDIERLGALVVTHPDDDHAGGAADVLATVPTATVARASSDPGLVAAAGAAGARPTRLVAGDSLRSGSMSLDVLWPPRHLLGVGALRAEPNRLSLVLLARHRGFRMLLAGDAEAEVTPLEPGPLDVLKVAHHGSEDGGLDRLLAASRPELAVISAGEGNPFGHPAPETLATLADRGVGVLRTDRDGEVRIDVARNRWSATPAG